ncbi:DUF1801 domain-containing protein [Bdellovibrio sp. HCB288]|uniref:DUF1801 domain-containing protein n=1 Tax=Bdellovibrio sp. HCB288 TaxID=3394355 RepID=UPI0039B3C6AC
MKKKAAKKISKKVNRKSPKPKLLSGGNPQIAKGDGNEPVQNYISAVPGWKKEVARNLDKLITHHIPTVNKAVKWNSPFYGMEGKGWFLGFHVFTRYVKVTFFNGGSLKPPPPVEAKHEGTRYLHIYEDGFDDAQFVKWIKQACKLQGWKP